MPDNDSQLPLPEDSNALRALVQSLLCERDQHKQQVDQHKREVEEQRRQTAQLEAELLRLQLELERYKKWYYGPVLIGCARQANWRRCCCTLPKSWIRSPFRQRR